MADYIFTSGTCAKSDCYSLIKNTLLAAGWTNVSSSATTDFDIFYSNGENGDKNLYIQTRPGNATNVNPVDTTDYCAFSYRLINTYIPKVGGGAGTFGRAAETWKLLYIAPSAATISKATLVNYKIHANKNRLIVVFEFPPALALNAVTLYIGIPDVMYCSDTDSRGLLVATSSNAQAAATVTITSTPAELAVSALSYNLTTYCTLAPKNPNSAGKYILSDVYFGSATEGFRGKLSGLYVIPNTNVLAGDLIQIGTKSYYVVINHVLGNTSFPSPALVIQVS